MGRGFADIVKSSGIKTSMGVVDLTISTKHALNFKMNIS